MRIKYILFVFWAFALSSLHAQTYDRLWQQIEQAQQQGKPQTAIGLAGEIFRRAERERQVPQMMKAHLLRMHLRQTLSPDSFYVDLARTEQWSQQLRKPTDKAVMHAILGRLYALCGVRVSHEWPKRAVVDRTLPDDLREWTAEMFAVRVQTHCAEAMKQPDLLLKTSSKDYVPMVELQAGSRHFGGDLYHLLGRECVQSLRILGSMDRPGDFRQQADSLQRLLVETYLSRGNKEAALLLELENIDEMQIGSRLSNSNFWKECERLKSLYTSLPLCAEVYLKQASAATHDEPALALQLCNEAIGHYPSYHRIGALEALKADILHPVLSVSLPRGYRPNNPVPMSVNHRNLKGFTVEVARQGRSVLTQHFDLQPPTDYKATDTTLYLQPLNVGVYDRIVLTPDVPTHRKKDTLSALHISRFFVLASHVNQDEVEFRVLDAESGASIPRARLEVYDRDSLTHRPLTDEQGRWRIAQFNRSWKVRATQPGDEAMLPTDFYFWTFRQEMPEQEGRLSLLTDRAIYRPGQTVLVKGVFYTQKTDEMQVCPDRPLRLRLLDSRGEEVSKQEVKTGEFGSFATQFPLPASVLGGVFRLTAETLPSNNEVSESRQWTAIASFRVESYKRPTFEVALEQPQGGYGLGDSLLIHGKAMTYSGVPVQGATVSYAIHLTTYRGWFLVGKEEKAVGTVVPNGEGAFSVPVSLLADEEADDDEWLNYNYRVQVTVTSPTGETQTAEQSLAMGRRSLLLTTNLPQVVCKEASVPVTFEVQNLSREPWSGEGAYRLYRLTDAGHLPTDAAPALQGVFHSNTPTPIDWEALPSGSYRLEMEVTDEKGRRLTAQSHCTLFSSTDARLPKPAALWLYATQDRFDEQTPAVCYLGTSETDAHILMRLVRGATIVEERSLTLSNELRRFELPYRKDYGEGLVLTAVLVKRSEVYRGEAQLLKKQPETKLQLKWKTFRDRLKPGAHETWTLSVLTPQGTPAKAEVMAWMYDASLDAFARHRVNWMPRFHRSVNYYRWAHTDYPSSWLAVDWKRTVKEVKPMDEFNTLWGEDSWKSGWPFYGFGFGAHTGGLRMATASMPMTRVMNVESDEVAYKHSEAPVEILKAGSDEDAAPESTVAVDASLRTNFAETAFFHPHLRTNEAGEVEVDFVVPHSLTTWNLRSLAHTQQMNVGMLESTAVARKDFTIVPNLPRFLRQGDSCVVAASLANLSGERQEGTARLVLTNPEDERVLVSLEQPFSINTQETKSLHFAFKVPTLCELTVCTLVAKSKHFSDGEQRLLPVLSRSVSLTEAVPLSVQGPGKHRVSLAPLFGGHHRQAANGRLTVEYTEHPIWCAVQALPVLGEPTHGDALSLAAAFYANGLAAHLADANPRILSILEQWQRQASTDETLLSNLQKNEELKDLLLQESPWLLDARSEQEQRAGLAKLLEPHRLKLQNDRLLNRLSELQDGDGLWSWFKGMPGGRGLTTYVATLLARLSVLTGTSPTEEAHTALNRAMERLHRMAIEAYRQQLQAKDTETVGVPHDVLSYLYLASLTGYEPSTEGQSLKLYYLDRLPRLLAQASMADKALAAIVLHRSGRGQEAKDFIASIKEHLTRSPEQGAFFDFGSGRYDWCNRSFTTHVAAMEALWMVEGESPELTDMRRWLLTQKRTQAWESTVATADAVYALLLDGRQLPTDADGHTLLRLGRETLSTADATGGGLNYVKRSYTSPHALKQTELVVEKGSRGLSWGAVYARYELPIDEVQAAGKGMTLERQLYVERTANGQTVLQPLTRGEELRVGQVVVSRLVIRMDRTMEFVHLKDGRAACLEPVDVLSGYRRTSGASFYQEVKDAATHFFFDRLEKGVHLIEHRAYVAQAGQYAAAPATIQSMYAPEFTAHGAGMMLRVGAR